MKVLEKVKAKRWLFLVLVLIVIGGSTGAYFLLHPSDEVQAQEAQMQTSTVRQGDLEVRASGSGVLIARDEVTLGFGVTGLVAELHVTAGDLVEQGGVLAVQGEQEQLEAEVASAQLAVLEAQNALDTLLENAALVTAQAQLDLANAQNALRDAEYDWSVHQAGNRASQATLDAAEAELSLAEDALKHAKLMLAEDPKNDLRKLNLANAEKRYNSALMNWNWYTGEPTDIQQAQLEAQVAMAEAQLVEAERAYAKVADGPDPDEVAKAELSHGKALVALKEARNNLELAVIRAPMDGTILEVSANIGDTVSGGFVRMADLSHPYIEIYLDETDLDKIDLAYEVEIVFDALPDHVFYGHVVQIDPSLYQAQMVSAIRGLVELDEESAAQAAQLPLGMNASVDVIAGRAEAAMLVPVEALREIGPGEYAVFVVQGEELEVRTVEVALIDITFAAVTDGLQPGEVVSTGIVEAES